MDTSFIPLYRQPDYATFVEKVNLHYTFHNNLNNIYHTSFLQNVHGTRLIVNHYIKPLYRKYQLNKIHVNYSLINTSNKTIVYKTNRFPQIQSYLQQLKIDSPNSINQYQIIYSYTYPDKAKTLLDTRYKDIPWEQTFNGTRRALRHLTTPRLILQEYFRWCGFDGLPFLDLLSLSIQIVLPWFDKLKQMLHRYIDILPTEARYFFDIPTIAGYPKMDNRLFSDDPVEWLSSPSKTIYTAEWWAYQFIKTFGVATIKNPTNLFTLYEFAVRPWLWTTSGATGFSSLYLDGELVRTKFGAAVSLASGKIISFIEAAITNPTDMRSKISVFIKPDEKGYKRRLIANVPLGAYIIASYVRYLITSFTGENPIFMKLSPTFGDVVSIIDLLRVNSLALPLDESAYDYNVTRESWLGFFQFLNYMFPDNRGVKYLEKYFHMAIWEFDGQKGKWLAGMPSGLALTSFVNSWMNYIKQINIVPGYVNWAAGDDVLSFPFNQDINLKTIETDYDMFGAVANANKNWASRKFAEYLKRFIGPNGTTGYPARIYASLIYAGNERFFLPSDKLPELAELWKQFFDRLGIPMPEKYVASDLSRAISNKIPNFNINTAIDWLHSPRVHGGFGKLPYNKKTFTWSIPNIIQHEYSGNLIRLPRAITYHGNPTLSIGSYHLSSSTYRTGSSYHLQPILSYDDWEKRLNREDIDYHGPFKSIILDVIPLPCINFISTANLSQIAQQYCFNSYPNLHGTWNQVSSKLINASIGLANLVAKLLNDHNILTLS